VTRNFGLLNVRASLGDKHSPARSRADTPRDRINKFFPSGSILAEPLEPAFERSQFAKSPFDKAALIFFLGSISAIIVFLVMLFAVLRAVGL